jgi:hypothetical protein
MKRQRGRNRGGGGGSSGGGGKPQAHNANRAFDSNGPDGVKVRGNPQHVFEKYQQLARDANAAGDRVLGENYLQHAEHYFRLLRAIQPNRPASEIIGRDQFASGYDIDFEDESGQAQAIAADEAAAENGPRDDAESADQNRDRDRDRNRDRGEWQARDDRPRDRDRPEGGSRDRWRERDGRDGPRDATRDRNRPRDDRPRDERPRDERPRDDRPRAEGEERRERPERQERDRPERQDRPERAEREDRDPLAVVQPQGDPKPRERAPAPMLRDAEGGASHAPAFLQPTRPVPAPVAPEAAAEEKPARPRRRRAPRSFEGGEGAPATVESDEG